MNSYPELSTGSLKKIFESKSRDIDGRNDGFKPMVQILGSKKVTNGSIRLIVFDGIMTVKTVMIKSNPQNDRKYQSGELDIHSVVRLDSYWVSTIGDNDIEVLVVSDFTSIMRGPQINRKLESNDWSSAETQPLVRQQSANPCLPSNHSNNLNVRDDYGFDNNPFGQSTGTIAQIDRSKVCPISAITPFFNAFIIRCRITGKSPVRTYTDKRGGEGKVFSFDASDSSSDIRITCFNGECDKYFDFIQKDVVYYISKGNVRTANKKFSNLKSDYEISLTHDSKIELCDDVLVPRPPVQYKFVPIDKLCAQPVGTSLDVIGVVRVVDEFQSIVSKKTQKEYEKRDVLLIDKTLHEVRLTVWGQEAKEWTAGEGQILTVKNAIVGEFRGKTLSCVQNSILETDPDLTEAHVLKGWYDRESRMPNAFNNVVQLSKSSDGGVGNDWKYLSQINPNSVPGDGSSFYYNCTGTVMATKRADSMLYKSCGHNGCLKKVEEQNGFYFCGKCGNNSSNFEWRLMVTILVADSTGDLWLTAFQEVAEKIMAKSTTQLSHLAELDPNQYQTLGSALNFRTFQFRVGSKVDEYNNAKRVKSTCFAATSIDPIQRSKQLIQNLKLWTN